MNVVHQGAKSMKKKEKEISLKANKTRENKPWFDLKCYNRRKRRIRALRNFRIVQSVEILTRYKQIKNEYKILIKSKKKRSNMLSDAENDKKTKPLLEFLESGSYTT